MSLPDEARDGASLIDMKIALDRVARYIAGHGRESFVREEMTRDAVIRQLEVLGEASRRLSDAWRVAHPEIALGSVIGLRNVLAHQYDRVDVDELWEIASVKAPDLAAQIGPLLPTGRD